MKNLKEVIKKVLKERRTLNEVASSKTFEKVIKKLIRESSIYNNKNKLSPEAYISQQLLEKYPILHGEFGGDGENTGDLTFDDDF